MNKLLRLYVKLKCRLEGATAIEYAILVSLIAVGILAILILIRTNLIVTFEKVKDALT